MTEENKGENLTNQEEDLETEEQSEETEETSEGENLKSQEGENLDKSKELQSALAQKEHWRKKYELLEKEAKVKVQKPSKVEGTGTENEWRSKVDFLIKNRDFNEEEFDHIAAVASRKGINLEEAAKVEQDYIKFQREKVAEKNKIPSSSAAQSSSFEKKISKDMPEEDVDKILQERFEKSQQEGRSGL